VRLWRRGKEIAVTAQIAFSVLRTWKSDPFITGEPVSIRYGTTWGVDVVTLLNAGDTGVYNHEFSGTAEEGNIWTKVVAVENFLADKIYHGLEKGRAIAQAVIRRLPSVPARVWSKVVFVVA
jgi:hypothetical protein